VIAQVSHHPQLIRQARQGEDSALGNLFDSYRGYLTLLCRLQINRRLQGKLSASDVVQETFLEAQRDFPSFQGSSVLELMGWLRRILATNLANAHRHYLGVKGRDARLERSFQEDFDHSSAVLETGLKRDESPSEHVARREDAFLLAHALEQLPAHYRDVLVYRYFEDKTFPEIAQLMQRSTGSVEKLWARALVRLRRQWGGKE
jgi:RNA polymerase sigma-70 factor (ECF subfamily)